MKTLFVFSLIALSLSAVAITYYPACSSSYTSIVDGLKSIGEDSSYSNREKIAAMNSITNYLGTADQNSKLLSLLKSGKLIKSKSGSVPVPDTSTVSEMMNRLKADSSLGLTTAKKNSLYSMGTVLLNSGYEASFTAGILGNIVAEGSIGSFESSRYISHPESKPQYLKYMDDLYSYASKYSGKCVTDVSLVDLSLLMEKLAGDNWQRGKFGLGCVQWTGGRTYSLVKLYVQYATNKDKITLDEATKAEAKMIGNELSGSYKYIYTSWKSDNSASLNSEAAAYNAGSIICKKYEVPADYVSKAATRGTIAKNIFKVMLGKSG